ncbi:hypothetical protein ACGF1Z_16965 [Streptomyces sp. NPDC048018]|uniref:hypothetical protein n=1 Tax=Streptomyces sp. NPDC048018 TaxID=3365499 RepID=UPI0037108563
MAENPTPADRAAGGIHVSNAGGNVTIGDNNQVAYTVQGSEPSRDPRQEELLQAVRALRGDLTRVVASEQTTALDAELSDVEDEIEGTGAAAPGRLARLRQALADAGAVTGLFASAAAVGQAVGALLGG